MFHIDANFFIPIILRNLDLRYRTGSFYQILIAWLKLSTYGQAPFLSLLNVKPFYFLRLITEFTFARRRR